MNTSKKFQIVFLIDTNISTNCKKVEDHCREVLLTILRVLSHVSNICGKEINKTKQEYSQTKTCELYDVDLEWGFKFFNTTSPLFRKGSDHTSFKSFKSVHVESFEEKIKEAFFGRNEHSSDKTQYKRVPNPSDNLLAALTEVLHDFKWNDNNDVLTSPVNRRKGKRVNHHECSSNSFEKFLFVISKAPCSRQMLRRFSNKKIIDADIFLDSFTSPALINEYVYKFKISVNWIDMTSKSCCHENDITQQDDTAESLMILRDTCSKLKGYFILKDSVLRHIPVIQETRQFECNVNHLLNNMAVESLLFHLTIAPEQLVASDSETAFLSNKSNTFCDVSIQMVPINERVRSLHGTNTQPVSRLNCDLTKAKLTLLGCIPIGFGCDWLFTRMLSSYIVNCTESEILSQMQQFLLSTETFGLLTVNVENKNAERLAILQAVSGSGLCCLHILQMDSNVFTKQVQQQTVVTLDGVRKAADDVNNTCESLLNDVQNFTCLKGNTPVFKEEKLFRSHIMNSWHRPEGLGLSSLVSQVCNRSKPSIEKSILKEIQKFYVKEKHPPEIVQNYAPSFCTPICATRDNTAGNSGGSDTKTSVSTRLSSNLSRGRLMVDRARSASFMVEEGNSILNNKSPSPCKRSNASNCFVDVDLQSEDDLKMYLSKQYDEVLSAGIAIESTVRAIVTVACRYMTSKGHSSPQKSAVTLIEEHLSLSCEKLKDKFNRTSADNSTKITEYKLQVILRLEMECLSLNTDIGHQEEVLAVITSMLRGLSFLVGATTLREFLTDVVASYSSTLPKLLVDIHDELMLELPPLLSKFASPAAPSSVMKPSSVNEDSFLSAPGSMQLFSQLSDHTSQTARRSKFKQHPSISDFRQTKQILVKPKEVVKNKDANKEKAKIKVRSSRKKHGVDVNKAKRNLFNDKSKLSSCRTKGEDITRHRRKHKLSRNTEKSRTLVLGTPSHKQTSHRHLHRQERRRSHKNINPAVQVIAESPLKDDPLSSTVDQPVKYLLRESFYSSNSQPSRNFTKSLETSQKDFATTSYSQSQTLYKTRSQGTLASAVRGESPILSPRSRLVKSLISTPSPTPKLKKKHKHLRKSPRKSVKKLEFKDGFKKSDNVKLIFDGENANDFNIFASPSKGFKTPEKNKSHRSLVWDTSSCPTSAVTPIKGKNSKGVSPKIGFKNLISQTEPLVHSFIAIEKEAENKTPVKQRSSLFINNTPEKISPVLSIFTSPDRASRLRSSFLAKSPKKVTASLFSSKESSSITNDKVLTFSSKLIPSSNETCVGTPIKCSSEKNNFSTPKKLFLAESKIYSTPGKTSTPGKVTFSERCTVSALSVINPPLGEKSTPIKSILKGSPNIKAVRRVELQSVVGPSPRTLDSKFGQFSNASERNKCPAQSEMSTNKTSAVDSQDSRNTSTSGVTLCTTPTSSNKMDAINQWARRKKCSPKHNSPSLSPASGYKGLKKTILDAAETGGHESGVNKETDSHSRLSGVEQSSHFIRKRRLFCVEDTTLTESPSKKMRKNVSVARADTLVFGPANSPEIVPWEREDTFYDMKCLPTSSVFSQSSQSNVSNLSLSQTLSLMSPVKRVTRNTSSIFGESSQGFHMNSDNSHSLKSGQACEEGHASSVSHHATSATTQDNGSPLKTGLALTSPNKKQFSPALSASGLMHLIQSPLLSPKSKRNRSRDRDTKSPKARKCLNS